MIGCCHCGVPKCALSVIVFCHAVSVRILVGIPKTSHFTCTRRSRQARYQPTTQNSAPRGRVTQARSMTRRGRSTRGSARSGGVRRSLASQPPMGSPPVAVPPPPPAHSEAADSENPPLVDMDQLLSIIWAEVQSATSNLPPNSAPGAACLFQYLVCMWYLCMGIV